MYQIDYAADPEAARKTINAWVSDHTNDLIPELLGQGVITPDTVMTLVNALYLSAPWQTPFNLSGASMPFTTGAGKVTTTPGMAATAGFASAQGQGWTSVTIPYRGGGLAMTWSCPMRAHSPRCERNCRPCSRRLPRRSRPRRSP